MRGVFRAHSRQSHDDGTSRPPVLQFVNNLVHNILQVRRLWKRFSTVSRRWRPIYADQTVHVFYSPSPREGQIALDLLISGEPIFTSQTFRRRRMLEASRD